MLFREAEIGDIPQIQVVRNSVKENQLSDPALVTDADCEEFITRRGKGWVCEIEGCVIGFAIADLKEDNIWALFVDPAFEGRGVAKELHRLMLAWYFSQPKQHVWLGTAPNTRAAGFYRRRGWTQTGTHGKAEIKFEMTKAQWLALNT